MGFFDWIGSAREFIGDGLVALGAAIGGRLQNACDAKTEELSQKRLKEIEKAQKKENEEMLKKAENKMKEYMDKKENEYEELIKIARQQNEEELEMYINQLEEEKKILEVQRKEDMKKLTQLIEKTNYTNNYPPPSELINHRENHANAFNIQILGARGSGKSTFTGQILKIFNKNVKDKSHKINKRDFPKTGSTETTIVTQFLNITKGINEFPINKSDKNKRYDEVFICDQPGIGGTFSYTVLKGLIGRLLGKNFWKNVLLTNCSI